MSITAHPSDLQMAFFTIDRLEMQWNELESPSPLDRKIFSDYSIQMVLEAAEQSDAPNEFMVLLEVKVNMGENPLPGYQLFVVGNGYFTIRNLEAHSSEVIHNYKTISAVSMMVNTLRAALSDMTSYGPAGRYNLPAIDILDLIKQKAKSEVRKKGKRDTRGK